MNILHKLWYLFQTLPIEIAQKQFNVWDKMLSRYIWYKKEIWNQVVHETALFETNSVLIRSVTWRGQSAGSAEGELPVFAASRGHMKHTFSPCIQDNLYYSSGTQLRHTKCGVRGAIKMNSLHSSEHPGSVVRGRWGCSCSVSSGGSRSVNIERTHKCKYSPEETRATEVHGYSWSDDSAAGGPKYFNSECKML